jgi:hypothetical protein
LSIRLPSVDADGIDVGQAALTLRKVTNIVAIVRDFRIEVFIIPSFLGVTNSQARLSFSIREVPGEGVMSLKFTQAPISFNEYVEGGVLGVENLNSASELIQNTK